MEMDSQRIRWYLWPLLVVSWLGVSVCHGESTKMNKDARSKLSSVQPAVWEKLAKKKIYFGHQSVGDNIIAGLREVLLAYPQIKIKIQERAELVPPAGPALFHSYVGTNEKPMSKNEAFQTAITGMLRNNVDVAFFKYCYLDIGPSTEVSALFRNYRQTMDALRKQNPNVMFVHITAPLTAIQTGWKASVKKTLGKSPAGYPDNARRNEFNDVLRKEYLGKEPVFDLAKLETTRPDGSRMAYEFQGREYLSLAPEYTDDGGHLNETGRRYIAEQLLLFLAEEIANKRI